MIVQEKQVHFTTAGAEIVAVPWPNGMRVQKIVCVHKAGTQFTLGLFSRAFTYAAKTLIGIRQSGSNTLLIFPTSTPHRLTVGDTITVASAAPYNTTHVVTEVIDPYQVVTDDTYEGDVDGGTAALAVPTAERPAYRVLAGGQSSAGGIYEEYDKNYCFQNRDPVPSGSPSDKCRIYVSVSVAGNYLLTLAGVQDQQ